LTGLPRLLGISDRKLTAGVPFPETVEKACAAGLPALQLREKDLPFEEFRLLAEQVAKIAERWKCLLLINLGGRSQALQRLSLAREVGAFGIQGTEESWDPSMERRGLVIGRSVHKPTPEDSSFDFLIAAPVWMPADKPASRPLGISGLSDIVNSTPVPVYGLGGVTPERVHEIRETGAWGVAVRTALWKADRPQDVISAYLAALEE
jgi:thiamine-phosphate pyrophosphorylase